MRMKTENVLSFMSRVQELGVNWRVVNTSRTNGTYLQELLKVNGFTTKSEYSEAFVLGTYLVCYSHYPEDIYKLNVSHFELCDDEVFPYVYFELGYQDLEDLYIGVYQMGAFIDEEVSC